ncbi:hypothetical protein [Tsukamurella sp. PLM1]|uniref:DUF7373 family lipoprotein n=1 Tax=Tsukamurella sp. PLM1 TaxID=2929795 RepID=UPI00204EEE0F|nr:hypothetical protein [Tsukamurella sp. PLM1]BDH59237.1 hypothetical protein MTP03_41760 [Tsukamurella sp. PLM1]
MRVRAAVLVGSAALLAACSTTVPGSAVVDPSALPRPDTGSIVIAPREVGKADPALGLVLEGRRMAATAPLLTEIDPDIRYNSDVEAGALKDSGRTVEFMLGALAAEALKDREVGFFIGASDLKPGVRKDVKAKSRGITVGVVRMPSKEKAAAAVTAALRGREPKADADTPEKKETSIPGYDGAIAYTQDFPTGNPTVAFVAHEQYVLFTYGEYSPEQVRKYFDAQIKGLDSFTPTAMNELAGLPVDESGVAKYTLPPSDEDRTRTGTMPLSVALQTQIDVTGAKKAFDEAGVDAVGVGTGTVYRTKDAAAATKYVQDSVREVRGFFTTNSAIASPNVPGATCMVLPMYPGSVIKTNWCIAAVGRYVAEVSGPQEQQAVQRIGAEYLILRDAK